MLRQKPELNIIYISERMRHSLQPVARGCRRPCVLFQSAH